MYKIGEFSVLSKTTIKTLRHYEKEGILIPAFVDNDTGYRYYESHQLVDLSRIVSLRQIGLSIENIKKVLNGNNIKKILQDRKKEIEKELILYSVELSKVNYLLEENIMNYEIVIKELPNYTVYYKEGIIKDFSQITDFILSSATECRQLNPNIKCIEPDYCYVSYLDKEYKDKDLKIRYSQAVTEEGISNENIKFKNLEPVDAVCIYHKGSYSNLPKAYSFLLNYIEDNHYEIIEDIRERYIDGMWNKENENEWLTEIQVPIRRK